MRILKLNSSGFKTISLHLEINMKLGKKEKCIHLHNHLVLLGVTFVAFYWLLESAVHDYFFEGGPFLTHVLSPDGHEIWMRLLVATLLIIFSLYSQNVINQLKQAKPNLEEKEKETQRILENNPAGILLIDCATQKISYANQNALTMIGASPDTLLEFPRHNFFCKKEKRKCPTLDKGEHHDLSECELITIGGDAIHVLKSVAHVYYKSRPHLLEAFFDITQQQKMQEELYHAHAEMNQIFQTASVGMRLIDENHTILKINYFFSKLSGIEAEDAVGKKCYEVFGGKMCNTADCSLRKVLDGRDLTDYEVSKVRPDGSTIICGLTATRFEDPNGTIGVLEAFKDITDLKKIQNDIQAERNRLHNILFHQFESVGIITDQYLLEYQNELLKKQTTGKEPCYCYEVFRNRSQPCDNCLMQQAFSSNKIQRFEFDTASGKSFQHTYTPFIENNGQRKAVVSRIDITERKASMAAALNSERLVALGELAAGVAHEINNPTNGIINYAQILAKKTEPGSLYNDISNRIINEGDRIAAIVASLLSFSRRHEENREIVDIKDLLHETLTLTKAQLRHDGISLSINMDNNLPQVKVMPQEIQQVFLNIINNSSYALNEKYPKSDDMKKLHIDIDFAFNDGTCMVRISFMDFGPGIPPEIIGKVFNPFLSSKPKEKGTGLGLTISHKIVEKHGGTLTIKSRADEFTQVIIELPAMLDHTTLPQPAVQHDHIN